MTQAESNIKFFNINIDYHENRLKTFDRFYEKDKIINENNIIDNLKKNKINYINRTIKQLK